jgi:hypothetical protein
MLEQLKDGMSTDGITKVWKLRQRQFDTEFRDFINRLDSGKYMLSGSINGD